MQAISILGHRQGILSHAQKDSLTERDNLFDQCCLSERPWGAVTRQFTWLLHGWGRQVSEITRSTDSLLFDPVSLTGASAAQQQGHLCDVVASGVCCLLVFLSKKTWGLPSVEWKGSAVQPVLLDILLYMYAVPVWQLLSESGFGNFNNRARYFIDSFRVFKWCVHLYLYIHA